MGGGTCRPATSGVGTMGAAAPIDEMYQCCIYCNEVMEGKRCQ